MKVHPDFDDENLEPAPLPTKVRIPGAIDFQVVTLANAAASMKVEILHEHAKTAQLRRSNTTTIEYPHHIAEKLAARLISELRTAISGLIQSPAHVHRIKMPAVDKTLAAILASLEEVMSSLLDRLERQFNVSRMKTQRLIKETLAHYLNASGPLRLHTKSQRARQSIRDLPLLEHEEHIQALSEMGLEL